MKKRKFAKITIAFGILAILTNGFRFYLFGSTIPFNVSPWVLGAWVILFGYYTLKDKK
ncbi:MAG: hypothetical protein ISS48_02105 [Candidatus Aenigmarchaeota archaeon]|nr:hypothetical protein [Candidatus Aenigmarchaeota archaeon]